eukprot:scpid14906/ scgid24732/ Inactive rhomboid protein 1; Rhomboid family member 1
MTHETRLHRNYGAASAVGEMGKDGDGFAGDLSDMPSAPPLQRRQSRYSKVTETVGGLFGASPADEKRWQESGMYAKREGARGYHKLAAYDDADGGTGSEHDGGGHMRVAETRLDQPSKQQQRGRQEQRRRGGRRLPAWRRPSVKRRIDALPTFRPYFIIFISLVQVGITIYTLIEGKLAPIAFTPKEEEQLITNPMTGIPANVKREVPFNFFIGPSAKYMVSIGAKFTLCMRTDTALLVRMAAEADRENQFLCASRSVNNTCGMMDPSECNSASCTILGSAKQCSTSNEFCRNGIVLRPCCIGLDASCVITSEENCTFFDGVYHADKVLCRDANCVGSVCNTPLEKGQITVSSANQWFRFFTAIFLQSGVISALLFLGAQLYLGVKIEKQIGWLRIMLIYTASGVGGYLASGIFDPTTSQVGCSGAVFGLFSIRFVELVQRWQAIKSPCQNLVGLLITLIAALAMGTTPYLDNFANVGGFIFGLISSFIFVPYLTFGKFDAARKCCFVLVAILLVAAMFFVGFVVFYNTQNAEFCSWCSYINCVPYTDTFCEEGFSAFKFTP